MSQPDIAVLERWFARRDPKAFREIVQRHGAMVYGACIRILRNPSDAEDVAQECFETLAIAEHGTGIRALGPWLHGVATKRSLNRIRSESRRKQREVGYAEAQSTLAEPQWDDIYDLVDEAIAELPEEIQAPVVAHFLYGKSHREIAQELGLPRRTVSNRIQKGLGLLATSLGKKGIGTSAGALAILLTGGFAQAAELPVSLTVALGKLALSGAGGAAPSSGAAILGGLVVKKALVVVATLLVAALMVYSMAQRPEPEKPGDLSDTEALEYARASDSETPAATGDEQTEPIDVAPETCIVSGSVIYDVGKQAAAGFVVVARSVDRNVEKEVTTDHEGSFAFDLEYREEGYTLSVKSGKNRVAKETVVTPRVRQPVTDVVLRLVDMASLCGTVSSANANVRLESALIELHVFTEDNKSHSVRTHEGKTPYRSTPVSADGTYCLDKLNFGTYNIVCRFLFSTVNGTKKHQALMKKLSDIPTSEPGAGDFLMKTGASVSGRVTDERGYPIGGAEVYTGGSFYREKAITDEDGTYMLPYVTPSPSVLITAGADGYYIQEYRLKEVSEGGMYSDIDFVLGRDGKVVGHVVDADGRRMANLLVYLLPVPESEPSSRPPFHYVHTDEDGHFQFKGVVPHAYYFNLVKDGEDRDIMLNAPVMVAAGETTRVEVPFAGVDSARIEGYVTDEEGAPLRDVSVTAYENLKWPSCASTQTDDSGHFVLEALVADALHIVLQPKRDAQVTYGGVHLEDVDRGIHDLHVVMPSRGQLHIRVLDAETEVPLRDSQIDLRSLQFGHGVYVTADMLGKVRADGLGSGIHFFDNAAAGTVRFEASAPGYAPEMIVDVVVSSGMLTELDVLLSRAGTLTGQITLVGELAELNRMPILRIIPETPEQRAIQTIRPDADSGRYEAELPSGQFTVQAATPKIKALDGDSVVRFTEEREVVIEAGKTTDLDIEVGNTFIHYEWQSDVSDWVRAGVKARPG